MSSEHPYIFVSHSSKDAIELAPIIDRLRARKIRTWWSPSIEENDWDKITVDRLKHSCRIVAIITENTDSGNRDYVLEEISYARDTDKLIPIVIGERPTSLAIRSVISRIQTYFFDEINDIALDERSDKFLHLCRKVLRRDRAAQIEVVDVPEIDPRDKIEAWFTEIESRLGPVGLIHAFSYASAVALYEGATLSDIETLAQDLARRLSESEIDDDRTQLEPTFPRRLNPLLALLECEICEKDHPIFGVKQKTVRFRDPVRAVHLQSFAWNEFSYRRNVLVEWWRVICDSATAEGRSRLGFALGTLAQGQFLDLFGICLNKWLVSQSHNQQTVADIALNVASNEPAISKTIQQMVRNWAQGGTESQRAAAIRLACGFTGTRVPGLALDILRIISRQRGDRFDQKLFDTASASLRQLMSEHTNSGDASLFDLPGLIESLDSWVRSEATASVDVQNPYPLALCLAAIGSLPLKLEGRIRGRLSLQSLIATDRAANSVAGLLNYALQRHRLGQFPARDVARTILRNWLSAVDSYERDPYLLQSDNPLRRLYHCLIATAATNDDRARIEHLFGDDFR
ncbi:MAG: toll/interleukin-1 receptor domain-containing protein [Rhodospirillaceae bacterium]|nr:toll/interleukin-1 receptor domain-containing protein [Rhodospirillaceae bacterium]